MKKHEECEKDDTIQADLLLDQIFPSHYSQVHNAYPQKYYPAKEADLLLASIAGRQAKHCSGSFRSSAFEFPFIIWLA
jgi:hypothetical protein